MKVEVDKTGFPEWSKQDHERLSFEGRIQLSMAISFKRIADALEQINHNTLPIEE